MATKRFDDATEQARALLALRFPLMARPQKLESRRKRTAAFPARATRGSRAGFHRGIRVPCRTGEVVPVSDMGKPISVDKRRGFEGDGAAAPSQADEVGQIANFAICTYEVNACSFPLCARALRN